MSEAEIDTAANELDAAIADLYRGPLDGFVRRRDALSKELRNGGQRDAAAAVKALRKPSRSAWSLDLAALDGQGAIDRLVAAATATLEAQTAGGDVRGAMVQLRAAVRQFADAAVTAAGHAGQHVDSGPLANAVLAVLGQPDSFRDLRRGRLADIPDGGGLDFLAALPTSLTQSAAPARPMSGAEPKVEDVAGEARSPDRAALERAARHAAREAADALAAARARVDTTAQALRDAEAKVRAAEALLRDAAEAADRARSQRDRMRAEAESADAELVEAETAAVAADHRLEALIEHRQE